MQPLFTFSSDVLEHLSSTRWGLSVMLEGCDYVHSSGGYSSFVTCLLEGRMAIYNTRVGIIACSPVALFLFLYLFPMSIICPPLSLHPLNPRCIGDPVSATGLIKASRGRHDSHWHWQQFSDSSLMPTVRWTGKQLNSERRAQRKADGERQGRSEVVLELSW